MVTLFEKRYNKFNNKLLNVSINKYFGIKDSNLNFVLNKKNNEKILYFNVFYLKPQKYTNFKNVPKEISDIIYSYLNDYVNIKIEIIYTEDYPFHYPIWNLLHFSCNINTPLNLNDIFNYIINCHNNQHIIDWSPATDIEKDILDFIRKINIFEYIYT
jgi:hypothetical protein